MLLATAACNFSTSELQKVVRDCQFFNILTWKFASRHSGVQFFNISTSKNGPKLMCFVHFHFKICFSPQRHLNFKKCSETVSFLAFDLEICFSPQRHAIFQHLNFKKRSETLSFLTFSLGNALRATTACNFSTSQLQRAVRECSVLYIFT